MNILHLMKSGRLIESRTLSATNMDFNTDLTPFDAGYVLIAVEWVPSALTTGSATLSLRANASTTSFTRQQGRFTATTSVAANAASNSLATARSTDAQYAPILVYCLVSLDRDKAREVFQTSWDHTAATFLPRYYKNRRNLTTPANGVIITSLGVSCSTALGLGINSKFSLYRI